MNYKNLFAQISWTKMIKYLTVGNFYSIKNENVLEFDLNIKANALVSAHTTLGFAGANASGKTNILKAISFVFGFAANSFLDMSDSDSINVESFATLSNEPSKFHVIFNQDQIDYEYILIVDQKKVQQEEFYYYPKKKQKLVYKRETQTINFGKGIPKIKTRGLRENSSIISYAAQDDSQIIAQKIKQYAQFYNEFHTHKNPFEKKYIYEHLSSIEFKTKTLELLKLADIGISNFELKKVNDMLSLLQMAYSDPNIMRTYNKILDLPETKEALDLTNQISIIETLQNDPNFAIPKPYFTHQIDGQDIIFDEEKQSLGTLKVLEHFNYIQIALKKGSVIIFDEIERSIHQDLVAYLIGLFQNPEINTKNAQLIFSFHNTAFMEILSPEQLWFAEKNDQGQSNFYCAANVEGIRDLHQKNLETLYRIGRFGAKPRHL